jgi:hypothetical protein
VIAIGPGLPPTLAPGSDGVAGPLALVQAVAIVAARPMATSHRVRALIIVSFER